MSPKNLIPGQYQIGDIVFGKGTTVNVEIADTKAYDVEAQDMQLGSNDEIYFGQDRLKPTTIELTFHVRYNWLLPHYEGLIPNFWDEMPTVADFEREWKFNEGRRVPGQLKPLYFCGRDGVTKVVYGRPRQFTHAEEGDYTEAVECMGVFQRVDTMAYSAFESAVELSNNEIPQILTRTEGDGEAWLRVLLEGPITHPIITVGEHQIELDITLEAGERAELSSYPWQRRVVDSNRVNLASQMIGKSEYLDRIKIPVNQPIPVRWTSEEVNTWVPALGNRDWNVDVGRLNFFNLPDTFDLFGGRAVVRLDIFNPNGPRKFIGSGTIGTTCAVLYNDKEYATQAQYVEAEVIEPWAGRSGLVIMSNDDMTNYAILEVTSGFGTSALKIRTGSAYDTYSGVRAQHNLGRLWSETDKAGFGYDPDSNEFIAYLNGVEVASWPDAGNVVNKANRRQGAIFDMDGNLLTLGAGFHNILAYDRVVVPADTGRVFLLWQDAWESTNI